MPKKIHYVPEVCSCCNQTTTYLLGIDRGTVDIVKAVSIAIRRKGINIIHPWKEMQAPRKQLDYTTITLEGMLTPMQLTNLSRARAHGLIAQVHGEHGNYCMTTKGAEFLNGREIDKYAIMSKAEKHQIGYFEPGQHMVTVKSFIRSDEPYWEGIGYEIVEGRIVQPDEISTTRQPALL